ncbi:hypothetical protein NFI96_025608, partial [Prochilodus magdalenae]
PALMAVRAFCHALRQRRTSCTAEGTPTLASWSGNIGDIPKEECHRHQRKQDTGLYANVKAAYNSKALPPLGRSDHNLVVLTPQYKPLVQRQPASTRTVRKWSPEAVESLQGCFEATQWDVLCDPHNQDIDEVTSCVTDYINFCVDSIVPSKTIRCFANNKRWVTSNLKYLLNQKKRAFKTGDTEELKRVQTELRIRIKEAKEELMRT